MFKFSELVTLKLRLYGLTDAQVGSVEASQSLDQAISRRPRVPSRAALLKRELRQLERARR